MPRRFWQGWTRVKGTHAGFEEAGLAKTGIRGKEGVSPRIDWLGRVCIGLRQERLVRRATDALPCPFGGHDGKDGLDRRRGHRFCRGDTGRALKF